MIPRLAAMTAAAPTPSATRASTKTQTSPAGAATTEPAASRTRPAAKVRRRPASSAIVPLVSSAAASPTLIELRIQVRPATPASRESAVALIVASGAVKTMSESRVPAAATASARRELGRDMSRRIV